MPEKSVFDIVYDGLEDAIAYRTDEWDFCHLFSGERCDDPSVCSKGPDERCDAGNDWAAAHRMTEVLQSLAVGTVTISGKRCYWVRHVCEGDVVSVGPFSDREAADAFRTEAFSDPNYGMVDALPTGREMTVPQYLATYRVDLIPKEDSL